MDQTRAEHPSWREPHLHRLPDLPRRREQTRTACRRARRGASPVPRHQVLVKRLLLQLHAAIEQPKLGEVMVSPSDIVLSDEDVVQPDLYVMLAKNAIRLQQQQVIGPPDLAVEVLSPSTAAIDRGLKRAVFARHGVREYWVLDPDQNVLEQYVLVGRSLQLHAVHTKVVELAVAPGAKVDLTKVW
ncbi:MAG: Uma2 family endonuclease [Planctomycetota bacterium]